MQQQRSCFHANVVVNLKGKREGRPGSIGTPEPPSCASRVLLSQGLDLREAPGCVTRPGAHSLQAPVERKITRPLRRGLWVSEEKQSLPSSQSGYRGTLPLLFPDHWRSRYLVRGPCRESHNSILLNGERCPSKSLGNSL